MDEKLRERILKKNIELIEKVITLIDNDNIPICSRLGSAYESSKVLCEDIADRIMYLNTNYSRKKFSDYVEYVDRFNLLIDMYDLLLNDIDFDLNEQLIMCRSYEKLSQIVESSKEFGVANLIVDNKKQLFTLKQYVDAVSIVGFNNSLNEFKRTSFVDKNSFKELVEICDSMGLSMNPRFIKPAIYKDEYEQYLEKYDGIVYNCQIEKDFENNRVIQYGGLEIVPEVSEQRLVYGAIFDNGIEYYNLLFDAR